MSSFPVTWSRPLEPARLWAHSVSVKTFPALTMSEFRSVGAGKRAPMTLLPIEAIRGPVPLQPLIHLDALWVQVAGTLCNLSCTHCFVSCGPANSHHAL